MKIFERNNYLEKLPTELKMMIMQNLSKQDLCSVALVSKNLKAVALDPSLWSELTINDSIKEKLNEGGVDSFLNNCKRYSNLKSLKISNDFSFKATKLSTRHLVAILEIIYKSNSLVDLNLNDNDLKEIPAELLSQVISKLKKVNMLGTRLSTEQILSILEGIVNSNSLIELYIGEKDFSKVPTELLNKTISKLKKVGLRSIDLSTTQLVSILEGIIDSNSLIELDKSGSDFHKVPTELLNKAISKLKKVGLTDTDLSTEQLVSILEGIVDFNSLIELEISWNDLNEVPTELLNKAISKLKKVGLTSTELQTTHLVSILEGIIDSNSLIELDIDGNDLREVPIELLNKAISKLKKVNLFGTRLSTEQLVSIWEGITDSNPLIDLDIDENDWCRLEDLNMCMSRK